MSDMVFDIHRLVLTGQDVTPFRAERIRGMVELELKRLLEAQGVPDNLTGRDISSLTTSTSHLSRPQSDLHIANSLARGILNSLKGIY